MVDNTVEMKSGSGVSAVRPSVQTVTYDTESDVKTIIILTGIFNIFMRETRE